MYFWAFYFNKERMTDVFLNCVREWIPVFCICGVRSSGKPLCIPVPRKSILIYNLRTKLTGCMLFTNYFLRRSKKHFVHIQQPQFKVFKKKCMVVYTTFNVLATFNVVCIYTILFKKFGGVKQISVSSRITHNKMTIKRKKVFVEVKFSKLFSLYLIK